MTKAVIVASPHGNGGYNNGSGFLLRATGRSWLCTAAHIPLHMNQPHKVWNEWPQTLIVPGTRPGMEVPDVPGLVLPLFNVLSLQPRFAYLDCGTHIGDLMMLPLQAHEEAAPALADATRFTFGGNPAIGSEVDAYGYIWLGDRLSEERNAHGVVLSVTNELIGTTADSRPGMSGGPVLGTGDELVGLTIGHDDGEGRVVTNLAMRACIMESVSRMAP